MQHLVRAGLLVAAATVLFLGFRAAVIQGVFPVDDFGLRPIDRESNTSQWANRPQTFAEASECAGADCHGDIYDGWLTSAHGTVGCETCHGPAAAHVEDSNVAVSVDNSRDLCELCHARLTARPSGFPQVQPDEHYVGPLCVSCHQPHRPGPASTITHPEQGDCLQCHGLVAPEARPIPADHAGRTSDQCLNCHESE